MKRNILMFLGIAIILVFNGCEENLETQDDYFGTSGKILIGAYAWSGDTVKIALNDENIAINSDSVFTKSIETEYEFVKYYNGSRTFTFEVIDNGTSEVLQTYDYTFSDDDNVKDTLSFFYKSPSIWLDDVLAYNLDTLSESTNVGYRFIFPNINYYSNGGYDGMVDAILTELISGQVIDTFKNIGPNTFSDFIEFAYVAPPLVKMQLVKHGTGESYLSDGTAVEVTMSIEKGKSKLVVLEETADEDGNFDGVDASLDLTQYFDY